MVKNNFMRKEKFVVFYNDRKSNKKLRLYVKANNFLACVSFCIFNMGIDILNVKRLKRIYRKTDAFLEV